MQDANLASSNTFGVSGIAAAGFMTWDTANNWIAGMNSASYLGSNDWRLTTALNQDGSGPCSGVNCTGSEMGHLFYNELGGTAGNSISTSGDPDLALFTNIQTGFFYWSGTESASNALNAWTFSFGSGNQDVSVKTFDPYAWAVRPGNASAVPEPSTFLLLGSGLAGLIGFGRKKGRING